MEKILSYEEYKKKIDQFKTPEEIAAFSQELSNQMLEELKLKNAQTKKEEITEKTIQSTEIGSRIRNYKVNQIGVTEINSIIPWYDVIGNDAEARIISLYSKGLTTRDISSYMKSAHGMEISQSSISNVTDKVFPLVKEWQARPLSACYPIVYFDGLYFKVRDSGKIVSKVAHIVLGINQYGQKEILGIWINETEGAKFWMHVLTELKNRGVDDILIACVDGLKGFPESIKAIFPHTEIQICITHQIRRTIMFIPQKDKKKFCHELKSVYTAMNDTTGMDALKTMQERWPQYRAYLKNWEDRWSDLSSFFGYPEQVRKMIYTTNRIENLNRQFRKVTKTTIIFPHDDSLMKLLWLAQTDITQTWFFPTRNWGDFMAQINILFPDRIKF